MAYVLLPAGGPAYLALNPVGAALAGLSSYRIDFMPFVLLKGRWAMVAFVGLMRAWPRRHVRAAAWPRTASEGATEKRDREDIVGDAQCMPWSGGGIGLALHRPEA